ncbi:pirin family protein [Helicobacter baculiformis]|uniref:Pirin family protein n=1 Tax=Helicobacter baculiformis TaxID=427351 RepID=A0ABV7ZH31_9HELI|nr:pirin family protein [Helicobacter baculiformis]
MKKIASKRDTSRKHWVGDGFYVSTMINYNHQYELFDLFLLLDYNAPYHFEAGVAHGVGEHPHRGFETVTLVYQGEVAHRDSHGGGGVIGAGDVQWMSAASGVMHQEFHSEAFARTGGIFEAVQLWVNLPKAHKMSPPKYQAIQSKDIPVLHLKGGNGIARIIAGQLEGVVGIAHTFSPINLWDVIMCAGKSHVFRVPESHNLVILVLGGSISIENTQVSQGTLLSFQRGGKDIDISAINEAKLLILTGEPLNESVAGYGPFVMNTQEEIRQAIDDLESGKFGQIVEG